MHPQVCKVVRSSMGHDFRFFDRSLTDSHKYCSLRAVLLRGVVLYNLASLQGNSLINTGHMRPINSV
jgi:hypothetical protein